MKWLESPSRGLVGSGTERPEGRWMDAVRGYYPKCLTFRAETCGLISLLQIWLKCFRQAGHLLGGV